MEPFVVTLSGPALDSDTQASMELHNIDVRPVDILTEGWQSLEGARAHILGGPEVIGQTAVEQLPASLELVCFLGTGYTDYMDPALLAAKGIASCYTPHANAAAVAEFTLTLLLAGIRNLDDGLTQIGQARWDPPMGRSLATLEVGVLGFGHVGQELVRLLHQGFGLTPRVWNRTPRHVDIATSGGEAVELTELIESSDVLLLCASPGKDPLLTSELLAGAKTDQVVINTARAELVNPRVLHDHLLARPDIRWFSDVYYTEPVNQSIDTYGLLALGPSRFCLTPHMAYASSAASSAMGQIVIENLVALQTAQPLPNVLADPRQR